MNEGCKLPVARTRDVKVLMDEVVALLLVRGRACLPNGRSLEQCHDWVGDSYRVPQVSPVEQRHSIIRVQSKDRYKNSSPNGCLPSCSSARRAKSRIRRRVHVGSACT